jgi:hypothetical protein
MPRTGRPPLSDDEIQARIQAYCARYHVKDRNEAGFPVFPAGRRETKQHRDWMTLYRVFNRSRLRSGKATVGAASCPICLQPGPFSSPAHRRCANAVARVRELGPESLDRIRLAAFPDQATGKRKPAGS